jgi:hypothetical protein
MFGFMVTAQGCAEVRGFPEQSAAQSALFSRLPVLQKVQPLLSHLQELFDAEGSVGGFISDHYLRACDYGTGSQQTCLWERRRARAISEADRLPCFPVLPVIQG